MVNFVKIIKGKSLQGVFGPFLRGGSQFSQRENWPLLMSSLSVPMYWWAIWRNGTVPARTSEAPLRNGPNILERIKKISRILFVLLAVGFFAAWVCKSEEKGGPSITVIRLKSGGVIEGVIVEKSKEGVVVDLGFGTVALASGDIEKITSPAGGNKEESVKKWEEHVSKRGLSSEEKGRDIEKFHERIKESIRLKEETAKKDMEVRYSGKNRIVVEAILNKEVKVKLIVDTGAPMVFVAPKVAAKLVGIEKRESEKIDVQWLDGSRAKGIPILFNSIKVGEAEAENVRGVVADVPAFWEEGVDGLLGMTFLDNFHVKIDTENKKLILEKK